MWQWRLVGVGRPLFVAVSVCVLALSIGIASAAARNFDAPASNDPSQQFTNVGSQRADTPNDPDYDRAETTDEDKPPGGTVPQSSNIYDERFDLFGFPSDKSIASAKYLAGPNAPMPQVSGFNAAGAWKLERGRPDVSVAILDTGIKWSNEDLRTQVRLNKGELPVPNHGRAT